jgi:hypothetical protein
MTTEFNRDGEPRCPVCPHFLRGDGAGGWICGKRGGCGSEFHADSFELLLIPTRQDRARMGAAMVTPQCLCGRFARHVRYQANTMPLGESVLTVDCTRCGRVNIS